MSDRLFVPLNKEWYNLFLAGKKKWEIRGYSSRFNEKTVKVGRDVELRKGYMKEDAIWGKIVEVHIVSTVYIPIINIMDELFPIPANSPLWNEIREYNTKYPKFVVFKIEVKKGEDVRVIDLSEENFMRMEFTDTVSGIDVDLLNQMSEQKKYEEVGEVEDLPGNIFEWLGRNYDKITPEQREKIFMDLEKKQE